MNDLAAGTGCLSAKQISEVIFRNAEFTNSPEARLWLAVIAQAISDGKKRGGYAWFKSRSHVQVCELVGLNADLVYEIVIPWMDLRCD